MTTKVGKFGVFLTGAMPKSHPLRLVEVPECIRARFENVGRPIEMLDEDILYLFWFRGELYSLLVREGFICDFSSIPFMFPRKGDTKAPGAGHDALCRSMDHLTLGDTKLTWNIAAHLYYLMLRANGASALRARTYQVVLVVRNWIPLHDPRDVDPTGFMKLTKLTTLA